MRQREEGKKCYQEMDVKYLREESSTVVHIEIVWVPVSRDRIPLICDGTLNISHFNKVPK